MILEHSSGDKRKKKLTKTPSNLCSFEHVLVILCLYCSSNIIFYKHLLSFYGFAKFFFKKKKNLLSVVLNQIDQTGKGMLHGLIPPLPTCWPITLPDEGKPVGKVNFTLNYIYIY